MRLLTSLACLLGFALTAHGCGYGEGDYSKTYMDHISMMFTIKEFYYSIATAYDDWYGNASSSDQNDMMVCAQKFTELCTQYQQGTLTISTSYSEQGNFYYIYGLSYIMLGLQYGETAYISLVSTYINSCGYDTFTYTGPPSTALPPTGAPVGSNESQQAIAEMFWPFIEYQGFSVTSDFWVQLSSCWTGFDATGQSYSYLYQINTQCIQTAPYYAEYPSLYIDGCAPDYTSMPTCSNEQYYEVIGYIFSTEETRTAFALSFYNYFYSCGGSDKVKKEIQWTKAIKDSCLIKSGEVTITSTSGSCGGMEMVDACVELIYQLIDQQNEEVLWFITIYMQEILEIQPVASNQTFTGNVQEYDFMFTSISTSIGVEFCSWSLYVEFYAEWQTFCSGKVTLTWVEIEIWIIRFFNICCEYTMPATTEVPSTEFPTTEFTSELPTTEFTSELPTTEFTSELPTTEFTSEMPTSEGSTSATCAISTPEEECQYIISYFRFIGFLYVNKGWRDSLNTKCRDHKNKNPGSSDKDKAKHFAKATHECAHDLSYCGSHEHESSHECVPQSAAPPPPVTSAPKSGEQPPEGEDSWEYFISFAINVFISGDFDLLTECACAMAQYQDSFITPATFKSAEHSGEPTVSPSCDEIKSQNGIFIFFQIIAVECGFESTSWWIDWIIDFKAIFLSVGFDCGCTGGEIWTWSLDWVVLIFEFLEAMCCGCAPTEPPMTPPPAPAPSSWDIFRFFAWFCSNEEYVVKFECFMSWYFEENGWTQFEELTDEEAFRCISECIDYMIIVVDYPTTPTKPKPTGPNAIYITYDTFMVSCMEYISYKGDSKFLEMCDEKYKKCKDKAPGGSHEASRSGECPDSYGTDMCEFTIKYMAICQGVWGSGGEWYTYWQSWQQGWVVIEGLSVEYQWQQASYACDNAIQTICGWTGEFATVLPGMSTTTTAAAP